MMLGLTHRPMKHASNSWFESPVVPEHDTGSAPNRLNARVDITVTHSLSQRETRLCEMINRHFEIVTYKIRVEMCADC